MTIAGIRAGAPLTLTLTGDVMALAYSLGKTFGPGPLPPADNQPGQQTDRPLKQPNLTGYRGHAVTTDK